MSTIAQQLFQLQQIELALEANQLAQIRNKSLLGESQEVLRVRAKLTAENNRLEDLNKQLKSTDWEIEDLTTKINNIEKKLYGGKIGDPKELSYLQKESNDFKKKRSGLEDTSLDMMEQSDTILKSIAAINEELAHLEKQHQAQQKQLASELDQQQVEHTHLESQRQALLPLIQTTAVEIYRDMRKRKGIAVARVEKGTCNGCRITLPNSDLQQAKGGGLVKCSSCGRILFLP